MPATAFPLATLIAALPVAGSPVSAVATALPAHDSSTDMWAVIRAVKGLTLDELERIAIEVAIANVSGSLPSAAKALGVSP